MSRRRPEGSVPPGTTIGRYVIETLLGSGGMGEVYRARDLQLRRSVALKILSPDRAGDPLRVQRFIREAQLASSLNHPAIVAVHDAGSATIGDGTLVHFLAMELVDGETLAEWSRASRDKTRTVEVLAAVADGLARAHASGIVHRDLKPQNIMVARGGHPKIVDFGVAKLAEAQPGVVDSFETAPSHAVGTGAYMSPEQVEGIVVDHRADIFAFGAVLYESLTGTAPFARPTVVESMHAVLQDQPPEPDLAPELLRIIRKCLVKDREERYQSIKDVAIDLRDIAHHGPLEARKHSRKMGAAGLAAAITVAVILAFGFTRDRGYERTALAAPATVAQPVMLRLTNSGNIQAGAVSPDGNYVAHATSDGPNQTMWVKQVATGTNVRIIPPAPVYYQNCRVSSDGNYFFYTVATVAEPNIVNLRRIPILGGEPRLVAANIEGHFTVSPDSKRVAFMRFNAFERLYRLSVADVETGVETLLLARPYPQTIGAMAWHPDGRTITFVGPPLTQRPLRRPALFSIDVATRRVTPYPAPDWPGIGGLTWLPDGSGLLVTVWDKQEPKQIYLLSKGSRTARKITSDISVYGSVSVTADSRSIVAHRSDFTSNIWEFDSQQSKMRPLTTGMGNCYGTAGVRWTADGKVLYTVCGGAPSLTLLDPATGQSREVVRGFPSWAPAVSPDGSHLAFISDRGGAEDLWISDSNGGGLKQLTHERAAGFPNWSPDGKSIYYQTRGNEQAVWRVTLDGKEERIIAQPTFYPSLSADGKLLLCRLRSPDGHTPLWRSAIVPVDAPSKLRYLDHVPRVGGGAPRAQWITADTFAFLDYFDGVANLWISSTRDAAPRQVTKFDSGQLLAYDFSRDGRHVVMAHTEQINDLVIIRDFRNDAPLNASTELTTSR